VVRSTRWISGKCVMPAGSIVTLTNQLKQKETKESCAPYVARCKSPKDRVKARASWNFAVVGVCTRVAHS
jgi:hypothetical protein